MLRRYVVVSFLALVASPALAGTLECVVRTRAGTAMAHLAVEVAGPSGTRTVVTGPDGRFRLAELAPGDYRLASLAPGSVLSPADPVAVGDAEASVQRTLVADAVREHVVVSATRGDAVTSALGISVSALEGDRIAEREPSDFLHLLQDVPGVAVARTGGAGQQASAFVRGGNSNFQVVLVDGVPVNEPGGAYDFGSQLPLDLERVEVVRGAASALYGNDALAGAIHLVTRRPAAGESASFRAEAEGGSFDWRRAQAGTSGRSGSLDWNAGLVRLETDNEEPNSAFDETAGAAALGARLGERSSARVVVRTESSDHGTPGQTAYGRPDTGARFDWDSLVVSAQARHVGARIAHELHGGFSSVDHVTRDTIDSGPFLARSGDRVAPFELPDSIDTAGFQNETRRLTLGYKADVQAGGRHLLTAGADVERESGAVGQRPDGLISPERTNVGAYVQDRVVLGDRAFLTAGARLEHNDSFGTRVVPRVALALRLRGGADGTTLRASAGAGIKEPDFFESFGISFFAQGNPDLKPERSRTYDVGLEQRGLGGRLSVEATAFHHDYLDQIAYHIVDFTTFQGTFVNLGKTRARGLELSLRAVPVERLRLSADYTLLDGEVIVSDSDFDPVYAVGRSLLRRPRHQAALGARVGDDRASVGATLVRVGRRADSDFAGLGFTENEGYTRLDARAHVRVARGLQAFVVSENLLDRRYEEALGYPALGRSIRVGLRFRGGEPRP
jgi:outer membrane cobalamin receptor